MANLKELRTRIVSIGSTMKITSAMKMVSAAKLKKAQDAIQSMRPYSQKLTEILQNVSSSLSADENPYAKERDVKKVLLVLLTSNRGLCGPFNSSVIKAAQARMRELSQVEVELMTIGKKANDILKRTGKVKATNNDIWNDLTYENNAEIAQEIMEGFIAGKWDRVEIIYNQFKNAAVQAVQVEQYLPISIKGGDSSSTDYIYEPNKVEILEEMIPISLKTQLFKALLDSNASEHGARMTAMHKATDNAGELKSDLSLEYNKARQAAITNEILEIVSGANALEG
jgi:F-type H+-transporting ATPase subunit gamma